MIQQRLLAAAAAVAIVAAAPAAIAADVTDIGFVDQNVLATVPSFVAANKRLNEYGTQLQKQYAGRARGASGEAQQRLAAEFQQKMGERQRQLFAPLLQRAQVAVASVASSKNLSVVVDKRIVVFGGQDITGSVHDLLVGPGDPVPPVSTPPPSTVGFVDQTAVDAVPGVKSATDDFQKFKADQDKSTQDKLKGAKSDADRDKVLADYRKTLDDQQNKVLKPWVDKTRDAMSQVAHAKNLTLVVDRGNIVFGGTDITSDVTAKIK